MSNKYNVVIPTKEDIITNLRTKIAENKANNITGLDDLNLKILIWGYEKGIDAAEPRAQFLKVAEEFGEIAAAMARGDEEEFKDAIGDLFVTMVLLTLQKGYTLEECVAAAYDVIKGRTGKMVDGVFVKKENL